MVLSAVLDGTHNHGSSAHTHHDWGSRRDLLRLAVQHDEVYAAFLSGLLTFCYGFFLGDRSSASFEVLAVIFFQSHLTRTMSSRTTNAIRHR